MGISAVTTTGKYRRLIAGAALAVATLASTVPAAAQTPPPDPVIGAAGDIACDPADPNFSGADPATCQHRATAGLLSGATAVLPLGDVQYEEPALAKYENGYGAPGSWGDYNSVVRPAIGNHEYKEPGAAGYFDYFNSRGVVTGARDQALQLQRRALASRRPQLELPQDDRRLRGNVAADDLAQERPRWRHSPV